VLGLVAWTVAGGGMDPAVSLAQEAAAPAAPGGATPPPTAPDATSRPARRRRPRRRTTRRPAEPAPEPPPPPPPPRAGTLAPMPNRDIEPPRARIAPDAPSLGPTFIQPRGGTRGSTFEDDEFQRRQDRLFDEPAPGARLRVPFSY
jgi:hypothetical protein